MSDSGASCSASIPTRSSRRRRSKLRHTRATQLEEYYSQHYSPSDALLIVVGDFAAAEMFKQIERTFGDWRAPQPEAPQSG